MTTTTSYAALGENTPRAANFFGKDFTRKFYPVEGGAAVALPSQTPTIYIFSTQPTRAEAIAGTGAVQTVSTWTQGAASPYACMYTVTAINDPDTSASQLIYTYWEALNFITKTAGQTQTIIRALDLQRAVGTYDTPGTLATDLTSIYPAISDYYSPTELEQNIALAQEEFRIDLLAKGWRWEQIGELKNARYVLAYLALANLCFSQSKEENDRFDRKYQKYKKKYEALRDAVPLRADNDMDGDAESAAKPQNNTVISIR